LEKDVTPERYTIIKKVFLRAVEVEKKDLKLLLDAECGSDLELRREVEALLEFHVGEPE
jgi:hypothetical protein